MDYFYFTKTYWDDNFLVYNTILSFQETSRVVPASTFIFCSSPVPPAEESYECRIGRDPGP
jgi:hypothetical protein